MALVVVTNRIPAEGLEALRAEHEVRAWEHEECISRADCLRLVAGADAVVTLLTEKVDGEFLDAAGPQLQVVANVAVGYNNIDVAACQARGVIATNTPKVLTETTADTAFGLMLMVTRRFGEGERIIRSQTPWQWGMFYLLGMGLQGKTLGIVGMGQIGAAMARRAVAFGMDIVYSDEHEAPAELLAGMPSGAVRRMSFDELLRVADVVSVHCPYLPSTHHLMGAEQFAAMKRTAYVVNSARGPIIDEAALVAALQAGQIAGAGLDVFEQEPTVHPGLLAMDNVVLLPHLGSATTETRVDIASVSKQFTCAAVLMLAEEGKLSLEDDIRLYLPEMPDCGHVVTIDHLMHNASGIRDMLEIMRMGGVDLGMPVSQAQLLEGIFRQRTLNDIARWVAATRIVMSTRFIKSGKVIGAGEMNRRDNATVLFVVI